MPRQSLKRRADGRYRCKYGGRYFYGTTAQEALNARRQFIKNEAAGISSAGVSVSDYVVGWLPIHKAGVSDKTYNDYAKQLNVLISTLGTRLISEVTPSEIKGVYNYYLHYSASTIRRAKMLYTAVFESAIEDGYIRTNPCKAKSAKPHKGSSGSHRALTQAEDDLILSVDHPMRLGVLVMRYAGLRRGEMMALDIDRDVDFDNHVIHVHEAVRYDSNQPILSDPKTDAGIRDVPLLGILENELKDHHGLVAASASGKLMSESAFSRAWECYINALEKQVNGIQRRWYGRTKKQKELRANHTLPDWEDIRIRPHDLRHSYCTMLRDAGVDIKLAMKWMGHADEKMIIKIYDHVTDFRTESAIESLEKMTQRGQNGGQSK